MGTKVLAAILVPQAVLCGLVFCLMLEESAGGRCDFSYECLVSKAEPILKILALRQEHVSVCGFWVPSVGK